MNSKKRLTKSMYHLLQEMPFEKITIQMIIDRAGVSRSTFYRTFQDKYELMHWSYQEYVDELLKKLDSTSWKVINKEILQFIYNNQEYYIEAIHVEGQNSFIDFLFQYCLEFCKREYIKHKKIQSLSKEEIFTLEFYTAGAIHILKRWIEGRFQISVEEMSELLIDLSPSIMKPCLS